MVVELHSTVHQNEKEHVKMSNLGLPCTQRGDDKEFIIKTS